MTERKVENKKDRSGSAQSVKAVRKTRSTSVRTASRTASGTAGKTAKKGARSSASGTARNTKNGRTAATSGNRGVDEGVRMQDEISLVASFGVMFLLMLSNFGLCGAVGKGLSSFFFGIFGCVQYVMPLIFFFGVTLLIVNDYSVLAMKKCTAGFALLLMIAASSQLIYHGESKALNELFSASIRDHRCGGILGGGIGLLLKDAFGMAGAFVIIVCVMIVAVIMLTQRSFVEFCRMSARRMSKTFAVWKERQRLAREERLARRAQEEPEIEEESGSSVHSFLKMKTRKRTASPEKQREQQCEEKLQKIEKTRRKTRVARKERQTSEATSTPRIHVPTFTSSEDVRKKDAVRELYPEIYPFTADDHRSLAFDGELDFTAFSFNSGKTPEEFTQDMQVHAGAMQELAEELEAMQEAAATTVDDDRDVSVEQTADTDLDAIVEQAADTDLDVLAEKAAQSAAEEPDSPAGPETDSTEPEEEKENIKEKLKEEAEISETEPEVVELEPVAPIPEITPEGAAETLKEETVPPKAAESATKAESAGEVVSPETAGQIHITRAKEPAPAPKIQAAEQKEYIFPPMTLLSKEKHVLPENYDQHLKETALKLQSTLNSFGVKVTITDISCGPTVTRYEMFPEQGTKVSKILSLTDDIKLNLAAADIRIEAPIPGKAAIGIEVPNKENMTVHFRELIDNKAFRNFKSKLAFAVGKDIGGKIVVADLAKMPHLLIAGATGSGKSVCINTLIMSILYKATPQEVRLIMIDPKMVELSVYNGIPHLLIPVVTDPKKASGALNWAVAEMTDRYKRFTECNVRNIEGYNKKVDELIASGQVNAEKMQRMSQIVIIVDELADLMMVAPGEVEDAIVRLSQLARAAGIHLVIATQRPSVNVITGLIKANVPSRIAFSVSSGVDSRTIIDMNGAEKLLGKGDMLFYPSGYQKPVRVQGAFISDTEVSEVVEFLKNNETVAVYDEGVTEKIENKIKSGSISQDQDEYFEAAARFIMEKEKATIGMLQRAFKIGFNRAARIIDQLAEAGIVGPEEGTKPRKILMTPEQLEQYLEEYM